ncbi:YcgN family cysteine cluster protein [Thalassotalea sp. HSM 43]|uniref:YcgN family cysteine cluster protein n=1 Tax=Thalassotalea sp. HSM 43 TaxID=2552945 RepID=UPI00107FFD7F|nr:YcgN family cysteine cluster protein [Thalassotalea sp. HSM 43]QBY06095.1 YcgN family cysteine cluster protein [Thalassotalea sp. HSM 43]
MHKASSGKASSRKATSETEQFWLHKSLEQMSEQEWESLCDGCGKCCLHKIIEEEHDEDAELPDEGLQAPTDYIREGEEMLYTNVVCHLLNDKSCTCTRYSERTKLVPDCVKLTQENLSDIFFMPQSCAYRRLQEGRGLPSWHPLLNKGKKSAMHQAGMSVRGKVIKDDQVNMQNYDQYVVSWPVDDID